MRVEPQGSQLHYDPSHLAAVCRELGLRLLVLYGSRATGTPPPTPDSDLDLAVLGAHCSRERFMTWYRSRLPKALGLETSWCTTITTWIGTSCTILCIPV